MASSNDQFAVSDAELAVTVTQNLKYCKANQTALNITKTDLDSYEVKATTYLASWEKAKDPSHATSVDNAAKKVARTELLKFLRPFVQRIFYKNTAVTDSMLVDAGLKTLSKTKSSYGDPEEAPTYEVTPQAANILQIISRNEAGKKSKPKGVVFIRTRFFIGDAPPDNLKKFCDIVDSPTSITKIQFGKADAGKDLTIAQCYVGNNGIEGPYGIVLNVKVP